MSIYDTPAQAADWRLDMARAELQQALEFDAGQRDAIFGPQPPDETQRDILLLRAGAIRNCINTALHWLRHNPPVSLAQRRLEHLAGSCDELCPTCNPREYD